MTVRPIDVHGGTDEAAWRHWLATDPPPAVTPAELAPPNGVVVLAAHPDDEVLGVGGLLHLWSRAGVPVHLVWATDGERSHPLGTLGRRRLAARRRREARTAASRLGLAARRTHLGLPDGAVAQHEDGLAERVTALLGEGVAVLAPWEHDGHPDHDACGRAARTAAAARGVAAMEYLVWFWNRATPDDPSVPVSRMRRVELDRDARVAKEAAVGAFRSQVRPYRGHGAVLPDRVLAHHRRPTEVVLL